MYSPGLPLILYYRWKSNNKEISYKTELKKKILTVALKKSGVKKGFHD